MAHIDPVLGIPVDIPMAHMDPVLGILVAMPMAHIVFLIFINGK